MRKVLLVHSSAELYGSDRCLLGICKALRGAAQVYVVLPEDGPLVRELYAMGVRVVVEPIAIIRRANLSPVRFPFFLLSLLRSVFWLARYVRRHGIGVVHSNTTAVYWTCYARPLCRGVRFVSHVREVVGEPAWVGRFFRAEQMRRSDMVAAVSNSVRRALVSASPAHRSRVRVIFDGLDRDMVDAPRAGRAGTRAALGLSDEDVAVVMVGRVNLIKGHEVLVDAFERVSRLHPEARLLLVGDSFRGYEYLVDKLRAKIDALGLGDSVSMLGFRDDVADILAASDIFVLSSYRPEGFGIVLLEAMAASLPVVSTYCGGPADVVVDGETGSLVPVSDPDALAAGISRLIEDPGERARMGRNGRARLEAKFMGGSDIRPLMELYGISETESDWPDAALA